jgi:hypothetical protein
MFLYYVHLQRCPSDSTVSEEDAGIELRYIVDCRSFCFILKSKPHIFGLVKVVFF